MVIDYLKKLSDAEVMVIAALAKASVSAKGVAISPLGMEAANQWLNEVNTRGT